jgi:hypothetical protein
MKRQLQTDVSTVSWSEVALSKLQVFVRSTEVRASKLDMSAPMEYSVCLDGMLIVAAGDIQKS